jgi:hypothetical protein
VVKGKPPGMRGFVVVVFGIIIASAGWNMFFLRAATFFERSERSSCRAGSLRWSISQFGSGKLNIDDLFEAASEGLLELERLASGSFGGASAEPFFVVVFGGISVMLRGMMEGERFVVFGVAVFGVSDQSFASSPYANRLSR